MKKSLIALAALSTIAGSVAAQSSVTAYGRIDYGYGVRADKTAAGIETTVSQTNTNTDSTSRIGFKGSEDLGGGLKANFLVETGFDAAANTVIGNRGAWAELVTGSGSVRAGLQNTGARNIWTGYDVSGATNVLGSVISSTAADTGMGVAAHATYINGVSYTSPAFGGLTLNAAYGVNKTEVDLQNDVGGKSYAVGGAYVAGPFKAAVDYTKVDNATAAVAARTYTMAGGTTSAIDVAAAAATDTTQKILTGVAQYDLGVATVNYMYVSNKTADDLNATLNRDYSGHQIGISAPINARVSAFANIGNASYTAATNAVEQEVDAFQVGARYAFSKRTQAYAIYGKTSRDSGVVGQNEVKANEYTVGLRHEF